MFLIFLVFNSIFFLPPAIYSGNITIFKSQIDTIDITGFSKCGLTSRWFRTQFSPFLTNFKEIPRGLKIVYHPLAIGSKLVNGSKVATCENGWLECQLNKLQCCSKKYITDESHPINLLKIITCIQGKSKLEDGVSCLPETEIGEKIQNCSKSQEGENLLIAEPFPHNESITLPWIKINGIRSLEATKNFQSVVCSLPSAKKASPCLPAEEMVL
ncbi:unnamed protein product [Caenorhabditis brenneri]